MPCEADENAETRRLDPGTAAEIEVGFHVDDTPIEPNSDANAVQEVCGISCKAADAGIEPEQRDPEGIEAPVQLGSVA